MTRVFIIHGAYGSPDENWLPWLKKELESVGCDIYLPSFPTPQNQSLTSWLKAFGSLEGMLDGNSIVVGHSLGCTFLLNVIEKLKTPIKAAFFVSGFSENLERPEFDSINKSFFEKGFDWEAIRANCVEFTIFHSDNDPHVSLERARELARRTGGELIIIENAGHFNKDSGYAEFKPLLERIKKKI